MTIGNRVMAGTMLIILSALLLPGQSLSSRILGTVEDEDGSYLPGVLVTAININSNAETTVTSEGKKGTFRLPALSPGTYQVSFDLEGYRPYVASGIRLSVEQSVTLRIRLKKTDQNKNTNIISAKPEIESESARRNLEIAAARARISFAFSAGLNYLFVGDSNSYLREFASRSSGNPHNQLETFHSGVDLNAEIGYRITPRLQVAVGMGLIQDRLLNNELKIGNIHRFTDIYLVGVNVKNLPLQLIFRYQLGRVGGFSYGAYGAILLNFASWNMQVQHVIIPHGGQSYFQYTDQRDATAQGWGFAFGGRGEMNVSKNIAFTIDLSGRYAPVRRFSGQRKYVYAGQAGGPLQSRGDLWFFEYHDNVQGKWIWELGIGGRPVGPGARNVSRAKVDFSGSALRVGLLVRF